MPRVLNVYVLPRYASSEDLAGGVAVAIDVLRASTTIIHALEAGAREVVVCEEIAEAKALARGFPPGAALLGGERGGVRIEGFDLANSPAEYTREAGAERAVVFSTTNGTRAIARARAAERALVGAFVNAAALVEQLLDARAIYLICAGTDGEIGQDDVLCAGMLVDRIERQMGVPLQLNAQALTAKEAWLHTFALPQALGAEPLEPEQLAEALRGSLGGRNLVALGMDDDILAAAQIDRFQGVPELDRETMRLRLAH